MAVVEAHPSIEELTAFTLGTLSESVHACVETHISACTSCQERAAAIPGDSFTDLLRKAHARTGSRNEAATQTASPLAAAVPTISIPPLAGSMIIEGVPEGVPPELSNHERYRVLRLLGAGGMGAVYQAEHRVMERAVAVKVIHRAYTTSPAAVERFRREVRNAALLAHPNIVATYDAEDAGDRQFLVMEYVEGMSLGRLVKERGPLPYTQACAYVRQAALGLEHAHERGMVHRDVKPDNLILVPSPVASAPGVVKVLDFGLAVLNAERGHGLTDANAVMGTPDFMAPEQAEDARTADIRADVYSLGCTLYYLLTGKVPYPEATSLLKILAHRERPLPSIRRHRPELPAALAAVLERMLAKKPADRYQTPAEVAAALEPFTQMAAPPTRRRRPRLVAFALAALAIGLLVAGGAVYRIQTDKGELAITTESDDVKVVITQGGKLVDIIDTKTDKRIVLKLRSGKYELELKGAPEGLKLDITKATLTRGTTLLAKIERVGKGAAPTDASEVQVILPLHRIRFADGDRFFSVDITHDGRYVLAGRGKEHFKFRVWDVQTGKLYRELPGSMARFSPDGKHVVSTSWTDFEVYELSTGKRVRQFAAPNQCYNFYLAPEGTRLQNVTPTHHEIYDWATGKRLCQIPWRENPRAFLTADGLHLLQQLTGKPPLRAVDTATGKEVVAFQQLRNLPLLTVISADGNRVICDEERSRKLFDVATGKQIAEFEARAGAGLTGNGRLFLTSTNQRDDYGVWDVDSGKLIARLKFPEPFAGVWDLRVSRDGRFAVFAGPGDFVHIFRLPELGTAKDGKQGDRPRFLARIVEPQLHFHPHFSRFSSDGKYLTMLADMWDPKTKVIRVWDAETGKLLRGFSDVDSLASGATFIPGKKQLLACHLDGTFRLWNFETGEQRQVKQFARPKGHTVLWDFSPDGKHVATSEDVGKGMRHFRVWEYETGREQVTAIPLAPDSWQHYCRFTPDGKSLVTLDSCDAAATDGWSQIRLHDLASGKLAQTVKVQGWIGPPAGFRDDGRQICVGRYRSADGWGFEFFDLASGKSAGYIATGVRECGFSMTPDGRFGIVCAVGDSAVRFLDLTTGKEVYRLPIDVREGDRRILVSPDSRCVAVGRMDGAGGVSLFQMPDPPAKNKP